MLGGGGLRRAPCAGPRARALPQPGLCLCPRRAEAPKPPWLLLGCRKGLPIPTLCPSCPASTSYLPLAAPQPGSEWARARAWARAASRSLWPRGTWETAGRGCGLHSAGVADPTVSSAPSSAPSDSPVCTRLSLTSGPPPLASPRSGTFRHRGCGDLTSLGPSGRGELEMETKCVFIYAFNLDSGAGPACSPSHVRKRCSSGPSRPQPL